MRPWLLLATLTLPALAQRLPPPRLPAPRSLFWFWGLPVPVVPPAQEDPVPPLAPAPERAIAIQVVDGDRRRELQPRAGNLARTWAFFTTLLWADLQGARAELRITDPLPVFWVTVAGNPKDHLVLVSCRANAGPRTRSVKLGRSAGHQVLAAHRPDPDWTIPYETIPEQPGLWRILPSRRLDPGEYGFFTRTVRSGDLSPSSVCEIFDFAVERAP